MPSRKELENALGDSWHTKAAETFGLLAGVVTPKTEAGTSYTLTEDDVGCTIEFTNSGAVTVTIPPDGAAHIRDGSVIILEQGGTGTVTVVAGSGVNAIRSAGSFVASSQRYAVMALTKRSANTWTLSGDRA